MKTTIIVVSVVAIFMAGCGNDDSARSSQDPHTSEPSLSYEGKSTLEAINSGKKCIATWSNESSKSGQDTKLFGVRELNGKTQYRVFHSPENGQIWTWDFRIYNIKCK